MVHSSLSVRVARLVAIVAVLVAAASSPALELPAVFSDHMVLQRGKPVPVWGWAEPGHWVTVSFAGREATVFVEEPDGTFAVELPALPASTEGRTLTVTQHGVVPEGQKQRELDATVALKDVLVGEVWLCGGQSNMAWQVRSSDTAEEVTNDAAMPTTIRLFKVTPYRTSLEPLDDLPEDTDARWQVATPETASNFSAVGYHFGRRLHDELDVPIGLVSSVWGGTRIEAWTSRPTLEATPEAQPILDHFDGIAARWDEILAEWKATQEKPEFHEDPGDGVELSQLAHGAAAHDAAPDETGAGKDALVEAPAALALPIVFEKSFDGVVWFSTRVMLDEAQAERAYVLKLGAIDDFDVAYVNGQEVGRTGIETPRWWQHARSYAVPPGVLQPGENTVAVRVFDRYRDGGLMGPATQVGLQPVDDAGEPNGGLVPLATWTRYGEKRLDPNAIAGPYRNQQPYGPGSNHQPSGLYNAMIHPLTPFALRGVIWYQGESNAGRAEQYRALQPALIRDWRAAFAAPPFSPTGVNANLTTHEREPLWFFITQLAGFQPFEPEPIESSWAELRDAQLNTLRHVARTGLAVTTDIGDADDIHPRNKRGVGERLAHWALHDTYDRRDVVKSGPLFRDASFADGEAVVRFDTFGARLVAGRPQGDAGSDVVTGFTLAGDDRVFHHAEAFIEGDVVRVRSSAVPDPVAVRYGWQHNPEDATLTNQHGLPASPFRSDDWPGVTAGHTH